MTYCVKLRGEDLLRHSNKTESVGLRKCLYYPYHDVTIINIVAAKNIWHGYDMTKLHHCHPSSRNIYGQSQPTQTSCSCQNREPVITVTNHMVLRNYLVTGLPVSLLCHYWVTTLGKLFTPTCLSRSQWFSDGMIDCGVTGCNQLCLSRQPLRCTVLGTGCAPFLQCLGRLSLPPSVGR